MVTSKKCAPEQHQVAVEPICRHELPCQESKGQQIHKKLNVAKGGKGNSITKRKETKSVRNRSCLRRTTCLFIPFQYFRTDPEERLTLMKSLPVQHPKYGVLITLLHDLYLQLSIVWKKMVFSFVCWSISILVAFLFFETLRRPELVYGSFQKQL